MKEKRKQHPIAFKYVLTLRKNNVDNHTDNHTEKVRQSRLLRFHTPLIGLYQGKGVERWWVGIGKYIFIHIKGRVGAYPREADWLGIGAPLSESF